MLCEVLSLGEGGIGDNFVAGQYATVESWTPLGSRAISEWEDGRLGSARPPKGPESRATFQDTNGISVSAFSERKDAAKEFARFMTTRSSSKNNMLVEGNPSVVPDVYEDDEIQAEYPPNCSMTCGSISKTRRARTTWLSHRSTITSTNRSPGVAG